MEEPLAIIVPPSRACTAGVDRVVESDPTAQALPLSEWAIHHGGEDREKPIPSYQNATPGSYFPAPTAPSAPPSSYFSGAFFPPPQQFGPPVPQPSGPAIYSHTISCWSVFTLIFNLVVLCALVLCALDLNGNRKEWGIASAFLYLIYLVVCLCSPSAKALRHHMGAAELLNYTAALRGTRAVVWASICCYHYETRTRVVRETRDGKTHTRTETYTEKVVTHSARENWNYGTCRDISGPPIYQPFLHMLEIEFKPVQDFYDGASFNAWSFWRSDFYVRNRRDAHQDTASGMCIDNLQEYVMLQQDSRWWLGPKAHTLCTILLLGVFYEFLILQKIPQTKYFLVKQLAIY